MSETTRFVAACCRWPHDHMAQEAVYRAVANVYDWDAVQKAVLRHRVVPLVHAAAGNIEAIPSKFRDWARNTAHRNALKSLQMTRDCIDLDAAFKAEGITPVHFKGPVLAQTAYDSVVMKFSRDLDIFVPPCQAWAAFGVLDRMGYRAVVPGGKVTAKQSHAIIRNCKDVAYIGPSGTMVELHWHLSHFKQQFRAMETDPDRRAVTVASAADLHTFGAGQLVPYLCMHGARHHWV